MYKYDSIHNISFINQPEAGAANICPWNHARRPTVPHGSIVNFLAAVLRFLPYRYNVQ